MKYRKRPVIWTTFILREYSASLQGLRPPSGGRTERTGRNEKENAFGFPEIPDSAAAFYCDIGYYFRRRLFFSGSYPSR